LLRLRKIDAGALVYPEIAEKEAEHGTAEVNSNRVSTDAG